MTDRHKAYLVVLDKDVREDDPTVAGLLSTLRAVRGVASVEPVVADGSMDAVIAEGRARSALGARVIEAVHKAVYADGERTL